MKIYVLNGPNLNLLGVREPNIYGTESYASLVEKIEAHAKQIQVDVVIRQTNHEGELVDLIQEAYFEKADGIVLNAGAYTHTSIALLDALKAVNLPCVEVHISNTSEREEFRKVSYIRSACFLTIQGKGTDGYLLAMNALKERAQ